MLVAMATGNDRGVQDTVGQWRRDLILAVLALGMVARDPECMSLVEWRTGMRLRLRQEH
jgi:hypothetical protein